MDRLLQPYPIVSQLLHSIETDPRRPSLGMGGVMGCGSPCGIRPGRPMDCSWFRRCSPCGANPSPSVSLGERVGSRRRCSPPQPTGLIKATARQGGFHFRSNISVNRHFSSHVDFSVHVHGLVHRDSGVDLNGSFNGSNIGLTSPPT